MPVSPRPIPPNPPTTTRKAESEPTRVPSARPVATASRRAERMRRGSEGDIEWGESGPRKAGRSQKREAVAAVAPREPPNSSRRAGKKTGKALGIPEVRSIVAKASQRRGWGRRGGVAAVARGEPPNSSRRAGKKTGKALGIPEVRSIVAKASQRRGL